MTVDANISRRKSTRLKEYDLPREIIRDFCIPASRKVKISHGVNSSSGAYFVTICTHDKVSVFGEVTDGRMNLSPIGKIAESCWKEIPEHFEHVDLDYYIVMPNHQHGILFFTDHGNRRGVQLNAPTRANFFSQISPKKHTLSVIIRTYKGAVTRLCRLNGHADFKWQRSFFDRIIRNEDELNRIREYIVYNPLKWQLDKENPIHWKTNL